MLCMLTFVLSAHAANVMAERSISDEWLERVLSNPEKIEADGTDPNLQHALGRVAEYGNWSCAWSIMVPLIP